MKNDLNSQWTFYIVKYYKIIFFKLETSFKQHGIRLKNIVKRIHILFLFLKIDENNFYLFSNFFFYFILF